MIHLVSFSGGKSSRYLVHLMEEKRKKEDIDVRYIYMDTGAEHPKTYEFIKQVVKHYDIDLACIKAKFGEKGVGTTYEIIECDDLKYDLSTWHEMIKKYSTPYNPSGAFCTDQLKGVPCRAYIKDVLGEDNVVQWWGIRIDEQKRIKKKKNIRYLAELSDFNKEDIIEWSNNQTFNLDLPHSDVLGNCVFCIKRDASKLALAARLEPEMASDFINLINMDDVRVVEPTYYVDVFGDKVPNGRVAHKSKMYRNQQSLESIIENTKTLDTDYLYRMANIRPSDVAFCSESCEAINQEEFPMDLFE